MTSNQQNGTIEAGGYNGLALWIIQTIEIIKLNYDFSGGYSLLGLTEDAFQMIAEIPGEIC